MNAALLIIGLTMAGALALGLRAGRGREMSITYKSVLGKRAQAGSALVRRDGFARVVPQPPTIPSLEVS